MHRKVAKFLGGEEHCKGVVWKAEAIQRFPSAAERAEELSKHGGENWEGQAREIKTVQNLVAPLYCVRDHIASCGQTALAFTPIAELSPESICLAINSPCTTAQYITFYWIVFPGEHILNIHK